MSKKVVIISLFIIMSNNVLAHNESDLKSLAHETKKEFDNIQLNYKEKIKSIKTSNAEKKRIRKIKKKKYKVKEKVLQVYKKMLSRLDAAMKKKNVSAEEKQLLTNLTDEYRAEVCKLYTNGKDSFVFPVREIEQVK